MLNVKNIRRSFVVCVIRPLFFSILSRLGNSFNMDVPLCQERSRGTGPRIAGESPLSSSSFSPSVSPDVGLKLALPCSYAHADTIRESERARSETKKGIEKKKRHSSSLYTQPNSWLSGRQSRAPSSSSPLNCKKRCFRGGGGSRVSGNEMSIKV